MHNARIKHRECTREPAGLFAATTGGSRAPNRAGGGMETPGAHRPLPKTDARILVNPRRTSVDLYNLEITITIFVLLHYIDIVI